MPARHTTLYSLLLATTLAHCGPLASSEQPDATTGPVIEDPSDPLGRDDVRGRRRDASANEAAADASADAEATVDAPVDAPIEAATDGGTDAGVPVGTATVLDTNCTLGAGPLANAHCQTVRIECPGVPSIEARLRIADRTVETSRGVIVFGSGGAGTDFYQGSGQTNRMMGQLQAAGFTLVDRAWSASGWLSGPGGVAAVSCRYATLLAHVNATLRGTGALCATGNSGGSAELGMNLGRGNGGDLLDYALFSSGPVHRWDTVCVPEADPTWSATCIDRVHASCPTCVTSGCILGDAIGGLVDGAYAPATPCTGQSTPRDALLLAPDSALAPGARTHFALTPMDFVYGVDDPAGTTPAGLAFFDVLAAAGNDVHTYFETQTGHTVHSARNGADRIRDQMLARCVRRH